MPTIQVCAFINAVPEKVYDIIKNPELFSTFMRDVKTVRVLRKSKNKITSVWQIDIDGAPIRWVEEDIFDDTALSMRFKSVKGDYRYEGEWCLKLYPENRTRVSITAHFDWGVPNFEGYFGHVYEKKARMALRGMLHAIKKRITHE